MTPDSRALPVSHPELRIDSHQHHWRLARGDYRWLTPGMPQLYRDFLPEDLVPELERTSVRGTVLVQAADSDAETDFLLSLASRTEHVRAVVGWVDMADAKAPGRIRQLARNPWFRGIRPMIQDIADPGWMLSPALTPAFSALTELDLSFDALVLTKHLDNLLALSERHPGLRIVIDHCAKPAIATGEFEPWATKIAALAARTPAFCKLSGLVTEAGEGANVLHLQSYVDHVLGCFGAGRLMWGSDWPVVNMAMPYGSWATITQQLLESVTEEDRRWIWGETAREFYRIQATGDGKTG